jgi:putative Holliday junction resolvase
MEIRREELQGKRIVALDFGLRRIGWAVCDELHLSVTPGGVLQYRHADFWERLQAILTAERAELILVGMPAGSDSPRTAPVIAALRQFVAQLRQRFPLPVFVYDETGSTRQAHETMRQLGIPRKKREQRGQADRMAAAVILWSFLQELHTWGRVSEEPL